MQRIRQVIIGVGVCALTLFVPSVSSRAFAQGCATPECDPLTDACCDADTCHFETCDPSVDPCCDATTCAFVQCNPAVDPCCDASTCSYKPTNAVCVLTSGTGAGCKTGQCNASHACQAVNVTDLDDGTACVSQINPCFTGQCDDGVCLPPDGPSTPWADRCEDANACTNDAAACVTNDVTGAFERCGFKDPDVFEPNGTTCSTTSGAICTVKTCQAGVCEPVSPPQTLDCSSLPAVSTCHFNTCRLDGEGEPECVADEELPAGTVCEASQGSNDWDCKHWRCSSRGRCRATRATEGKVCDPSPSTNPHCSLATCSNKGQCSTTPLYSTLSVVNDMETAQLNPDGSPVTANLPTCPSDNNACTLDRCSGTADTCVNPCLTGTVCGVPGVCEGECQVISSVCQCAEVP